MKKLVRAFSSLRSLFQIRGVYMTLLALNHESLQSMLDALHAYCMEWGLAVNLSKTAVTVFNRVEGLLKESRT